MLSSILKKTESDSREVRVKNIAKLRTLITESYFLRDNTEEFHFVINTTLQHVSNLVNYSDDVLIFRGLQIIEMLLGLPEEILNKLILTNISNCLRPALFSSNRDLIDYSCVLFTIIVKKMRSHSRSLLSKMLDRATKSIQESSTVDLSLYSNLRIVEIIFSNSFHMDQDKLFPVVGQFHKSLYNSLTFTTSLKILQIFLDSLVKSSETFLRQWSNTLFNDSLLAMKNGAAGIDMVSRVWKILYRYEKLTEEQKETITENLLGNLKENFRESMYLIPYIAKKDPHWFSKKFLKRFIIDYFEILFKTSTEWSLQEKVRPLCKLIRGLGSLYSPSKTLTIYYLKDILKLRADHRFLKKVFRTEKDTGFLFETLYSPFDILSSLIDSVGVFEIPSVDNNDLIPLFEEYVYFVTPQILDVFRTIIKNIPELRESMYVFIQIIIKATERMLVNAPLKDEERSIGSYIFNNVVYANPENHNKVRTALIQALKLLLGSNTVLMYMDENTYAFMMTENHSIRKHAVDFFLSFCSAFEPGSEASKGVRSFRMKKQAGRTSSLSRLDLTKYKDGRTPIGGVQDAMVNLDNSPKYKKISDILDKLLIIGITDSSEDIRLLVLSTFGSRIKVIRHFFRERKRLNLLLSGLSDSSILVKREVLTISSKLVDQSFELVFPAVRNFLVKLINTLSYYRHEPNAIYLCVHVLRTFGHLFKEYVDVLAEIIWKTLSTETSKVVIHAYIKLLQVSVKVDPSIATAYPFFEYLVELLRMDYVPNLVVLSSIFKILRYSDINMENIYTTYPWLFRKLLTLVESPVVPTNFKVLAMKILLTIGVVSPSKKGEYTGKDTAKLDNRIGTKIPGFDIPLDEFLVGQAISTVLTVINSDKNVYLHDLGFQTLNFIFRSIDDTKMNISEYFKEMMMATKHTLKLRSLSQNKYILGQFISIIKYKKASVVSNLSYILEHIVDALLDKEDLVSEMTQILTTITAHVGDQIEPYLPYLLPKLLDAPLRADPMSVIHLLGELQHYLDNYLGLVIPKLLDLSVWKRGTARSAEYMQIQVEALSLLVSLARTMDISDYKVPILQTLAELFSQEDENVAYYGFKVLLKVVTQLGSEYLSFIPMIHKAISEGKSNGDVLYTNFVEKILSGVSITDKRLFNPKKAVEPDPLPDSFRKPEPNKYALISALATNNNFKPREWIKWFRNLHLLFLRESPIQALRVCYELSLENEYLAHRMFHYDFLSIYMTLTKSEERDVIQKISKIFAPDSTAPFEVVMAFVELLEFMWFCGIDLDIDKKRIAEITIQHRLFHKAIPFLEDEFVHGNKDAELIYSMIHANNYMGNAEDAIGIIEANRDHFIIGSLPKLEYRLRNTGVDNSLGFSENRKPSYGVNRWYEELSEWESALKVYEKMEPKTPSEVCDIYLGKMRCLASLNRWSSLDRLCQEIRNEGSDQIDDMVKQEVYLRAIQAKVNLFKYQDLDTLMGDKPITTDPQFEIVEKYFFAVRYVVSGEIEKAKNLLKELMVAHTEHIASKLKDGYSYLYSRFISLQQIIELDEILMVKSGKIPKSVIASKWDSRFKLAGDNPNVMQQLLSVRTILLRPLENIKAHLKLREVDPSVSEHVLSYLYGSEIDFGDISKIQGLDIRNDTAHRRLLFGIAKHCWDVGNRLDAVRLLERFDFVSVPFEDTELSKINLNHCKGFAKNKLFSQVYMKRGIWLRKLVDSGKLPNKEYVYKVILDSLEKSIKHNSRWHKPWRVYAKTCLHMANLYDNKEYRIKSVIGFLKVISLQQEATSISDTLQLFKLVTRHPEVLDNFRSYFSKIRQVTNLVSIKILPQMLSRLGSTSSNVQDLLYFLLKGVLREHPQVLVHNLIVLSKTSRTSSRLLNVLKQQDPVLLREAKLVSRELIHLSLLWEEIWHMGLDRISVSFFEDGDVHKVAESIREMFSRTLKKRTGLTMHEKNFINEFAFDLQGIVNAVDKFDRAQSSCRTIEVNLIWDTVVKVFTKLGEKLSSIRELDLNFVTPLLMELRNLSLSIPGKYDPRTGTCDRIREFSPKVKIIPSKQRPRKIKMVGLDTGKRYGFLLKGKEDLRLDERVMQLFGIVNELLLKSGMPELKMRRYSVTPLDKNTGIIGWVKNSTTLFSMIENYRSVKKVSVEYESHVLGRLIGDVALIDTLTSIAKVEAVSETFSLTNPTDLREVLWMNSGNGERWINIRNTYTKTLASSSMLGYILGLGDRHLNNIMIEKRSGRILHIDFGDCFEVAMHRPVLPEKVPFRLTRMLINGMGVSGYVGNFDLTFKAMNDLLRINKDVIITLLETFVYDPIIDWIMDNPHTGVRDQSREGGVSEAENEKAIKVLRRIRDKLEGNDFKAHRNLDSLKQTELLISNAIDIENLSQMYFGWRPLW